MNDSAKTAMDSIQIAERLRSGDETVLSDILHTYTPKISGRLRRAFPSQLSAEDLDDVMSAGLFRVWNLRSKYQPDKSSFSTWFYVIVRSMRFANPIVNFWSSN